MRAFGSLPHAGRRANFSERVAREQLMGWGDRPARRHLHNHRLPTRHARQLHFPRCLATEFADGAINTQKLRNAMVVSILLLAAVATLELI